MRYFAGIDGCKAGWFAFTLSASQTWQLAVFKTIAQIWDGLSHAELLLIDIPIGLCEGGPAIHPSSTSCISIQHAGGCFREELLSHWAQDWSSKLGNSAKDRRSRSVS